MVQYRHATTQRDNGNSALQFEGRRISHLCDIFVVMGCQISPIFALWLISHTSYTTLLKYLTVRGLQSRGYIAECFHLFRVVAEGPKRCYLLFASEVYMQCLLGKLRTPKFAQIVAYTMLTHDTSDLNQKRLKMVIPLKVVPFWEMGV